MTGKVTIGLVVGALGLVVAFWGVPWDDIRQAFASLDLVWLVPIGAVFLAQQFLRAWRQLLLLATVCPGMTYRSSLSVLCISFFCINTLPARTGELVRPFLLLEREGIPVGAGFGAVFLERAIDFLAVLVVLAAVLAWVPLPGATLEIGGQPVDLSAFLGDVSRGLVPALLLGPVLLVILRRPVVRYGRAGVAGLAPRFPFASRVAAVAVRFVETFLEALAVIRSPGRLAAIVALTAVTWTMSGWMYVWLAWGFDLGDRVRYGHGMGIMVITMLGTLLPSPPGFAGVYEAFARGALALCGVGGERLDGVAVAFALVIHWWQYAVQSTTALWFLWRDGISFSHLLALVRRGLVVPAAPPTSPGPGAPSG